MSNGKRKHMLIESDDAEMRKKRSRAPQPMVEVHSITPLLRQLCGLRWWVLIQGSVSQNMTEQSMKERIDDGYLTSHSTPLGNGLWNVIWQNSWIPFEYLHTPFEEFMEIPIHM